MQPGVVGYARQLMRRPIASCSSVLFSSSNMARVSMLQTPRACGVCVRVCVQVLCCVCSHSFQLNIFYENQLKSALGEASGADLPGFGSITWKTAKDSVKTSLDVETFQGTRNGDDVLQIGESSLYPALQRLLLNGWVAAEWSASENNRRARYYTLTRESKKQLIRETVQFEIMIGAIRKVLA